MVIVLFGVLALVAAPKFFSKSAFDERFFFDDAKSALRYARQLAVSKGCYTQFTLNASRFVINYDSQCGSGAVTLSGVVNRPGDDEPYQNAEVPTGSSSVVVVFDPQGQAGQINSGSFGAFGSTQAITIGSLNLQVDGPTGFVR